MYIEAYKMVTALIGIFFSGISIGISIAVISMSGHSFKKYRDNCSRQTKKTNNKGDNS